MSAMAIFGLAPALFLSTSEQYLFYYYVLFLSWMSVATFSIESFANIRFPAKNERFVSVNAYILLILGLSLIITFLLSFLNVATIDYSLILILASGFLSNIKLIYLSWLRAYKANKANILMFFDGIMHFIGVLLIYFYQEINTTIAFIFLVVKGSPLSLFVFDLLMINIRVSISKLKKKHLILILSSSGKLFVSSIVLVYGVAFIKTVLLNTFNAQQFISASIALAVTGNIQKILLTYYWSVQKHIFSNSATFQLNFKFAIVAIFNVCASILLTIIALSILEILNTDLDFEGNIYILCFLITSHRILCSAFRMFTLKYAGVNSLFKLQLLSLFLNSLIFVFYTLISDDILYIVPVLFIVDFLLTCVYPLRRSNRVAMTV